MNWILARELYRYVWLTSRSSQFGICLLTIIVVPLSTAVLEIQRRVVDDAIVPGNAAMLTSLCSAYLAITVFRIGLKYLLDMAKGRTVETLARDLRQRIIKSALCRSRPVLEIDHMGAGTVVSMLGGETDDLSGFAGEALSLPLLNGGIILSVIGYLLWVEPRIAALALLVYLPQLSILPAMQATINRLGRLRIRLIRGLGNLAARNMDHHADELVKLPSNSYIDRIYRIRMAIYLRKYFLSELGNFLDSFGPILVFAIGGYLAITGQTKLGTLVVFTSGLQKIADPLDQLVGFYRNVSNTAVMYDLIRGQGKW
jgi:ABC-type multidrug transport system fused ATPase/permease subunit